MGPNSPTCDDSVSAVGVLANDLDSAFENCVHVVTLTGLTEEHFARNKVDVFEHHRWQRVVGMHGYDLINGGKQPIVVGRNHDRATSVSQPAKQLDD